MVNIKSKKILSLVTAIMLVVSLFTTAFATGPDLTAYNVALADVVESDYTAESWTTYSEALVANVMTEANTQEEVDAAVANIVGAQANLVELTIGSTDLTAYNAALADVVESDYIAESWTTYSEVLAANVMTEANTQEEVDAAVANIVAAQANLVEITGTVTTPAAIVIKNSIVIKEKVNGYISGYEDKTFRPDNKIIRAEVAQMLSGIVSNDGTITAELTDISGKWYTNAIDKVVKLGIMQGQGNGIFGPDQNMTRQDFAIAICNMLDTTVAGNKTVSFSDIDNAYGKASIEYLASIGVIEGYEDGTFGPNGEITRAEAVSMVNRLLSANVDDVQADVSVFTDLAGHWAQAEVLKAAAK